jgi:hypothetical protein
VDIVFVFFVFFLKASSLSSPLHYIEQFLHKQTTTKYWVNTFHQLRRRRLCTASSIPSTATPGEVRRLWRKVPDGHWNDTKNRRAFLDWVMAELGIDMDGWYQVSPSDVVVRGGGSLLAIYSNSVKKMLRELYPEHDWLEWRFVKAPAGFWNSHDNQRRFLNWVGSQLGIQRMDEWYKVTPSQVCELGGTSLLDKYGGSLSAAIQGTFSDHIWQPWRFSKAPESIWSNTNTLAAFFQSAADELDIKGLDGWYKVQPLSLMSVIGGSKMLAAHKALPAALQKAFPAHPWDVAQFLAPMPAKKSAHPTEVPISQQLRTIFDEAASRMGLEGLEGWYPLSRQSLEESAPELHHQLTQLGFTNLPQALRLAYQNHTWHVWMFPKVPDGSWDSLTTQRQFFDWLGAKLGIASLDGWYTKASYRIVSKHGAESLLAKYYNYSVAKALMHVYPEHNWLEWNFAQLPKAFWSQPAHQVKFIRWLAADLNLPSLNAWYDIPRATIVKSGGHGLLKLHDGAISNALKLAFPDHEWQPWKFVRISGEWDNPTTQKAFFEWAAKQLGVATLTDWYQIKAQQVADLGGATLLQHHYGSSLSRALIAVYPSHEWMPWLFPQVGMWFWHDPLVTRQFFDWAGQQLGLTRLDDWYMVHAYKLEPLGGMGMLVSQYDGSIAKAVRAVYPEHAWDPFRFPMSQQKHP